MEWVKDFYTRQREWLGSAGYWATLSVSDLPEKAGRHAALVDRLAPGDGKRVLELGCGGGMDAAALALAGHKVVAVDIVDACVSSARRLADHLSKGKLKVVKGNFYEIEPSGRFDVICYFDGFGIGSDFEQRLLLGRIGGWLKPEGCALIDVYSPWCFVGEDGTVERERDVMYRYDFDAEGSRLLESLWPADGDESQALTQSLRCYSPADFKLLLEGTGLALHSLEPYESEEHREIVPLKKAMLYLAKLVPESRPS